MLVGARTEGFRLTGWMPDLVPFMDFAA